MTAQMCTIYIVRHGQTDWNVSKTSQGQIDIPLNKVGESQAIDLEEQLKHIDFDAFFSSDLIRAKRTAEILNRERNLAFQTTAALRERNFGTYQGKPIDDAHRRLYQLLEDYKEHPHIIESRVETNEQLVSRALTFIREISVGYEGKTVLLVSHGGLMRTLLVHLGFCLSRQIPYIGAIKNTAYIKLISDGSEISVKETFGIAILPV